MKLNRRTSAWILIASISCASCSLADKESSQTGVHYFSRTDSVFLFPEEYRDKNYKTFRFEYASEFLNTLNEKKLYNIDSLNQYIRFYYWRFSGETILIRVEKHKVITKTFGWQKGLDVRFDTTVLTDSEWSWLKAHNYYNWLKKFSDNEDSIKIRRQLFSKFPDLELDNGKLRYLEKLINSVPEADSLIFTEKMKTIAEKTLDQLMVKLDSINFWILDHGYSSGDTDGSAFSLEVKNGNKYNVVECSNCEEDELIYIRNEILKKFTNLKKEEIY